MNADEYLFAWTAYLLASLLVLAWWCWITAGVHNLTLRLLLRLPAAAIALTPVQNFSGDGLESPASAAIAIELLAKDERAASAYIMVLGATVLASVVLALVLGAIGKLIDRTSRAEEDSGKHAK